MAALLLDARVGAGYDHDPAIIEAKLAEVRLAVRAVGGAEGTQTGMGGVDLPVRPRYGSHGGLGQGWPSLQILAGMLVQSSHDEAYHRRAYARDDQPQRYYGYSHSFWTQLTLQFRQ